MVLDSGGSLQAQRKEGIVIEEPHDNWGISTGRLLDGV
jgi:hypothetical protein